MPTINASSGDALRAVCQTAARTFRAIAHVWTGAAERRRDICVRFDPASGGFQEMDPQAAGDAGELLEVGFGGEARAGTLRLSRPGGGWTEEERALAAHFAGLAALARDGADDAAYMDPAVLRDPEAYFRGVFHAADAMVWVQDLETGDFLEANQSACELQGYTVEEFRALGPGGVAWGEPPYTAGDAARHTAIAAASAAPHRFEWCARHRDGYPVWVEVTLRTVTLNGVPRLLATGRRIDDRRAAEEALRRANEELERRVAERTAELAVANQELERRVAERTAELAVANQSLRASEEHFRRLIENGSDLVLISAPDGALTYVSPSAERVLGMAPSEMIGASPADLIHPDDLAGLGEEIGRILAEPGVVRAASWRIRHRDGGWRLIDARGRTLDPHSAAAGIVVNGHDVTEQRAAETALQKSEEHFRTLIENASDLIQISAPDGRLTYVSPSAERLLGRHPSEMIGLTPDVLVHPDDRPGVWAAVQDMCEAPGTVREATFRMRHRDGSWRIFEAIGRTISPHSADEGLVANARDVTERREAEAALQRSEEHFRALIENGSDLLTISGADGALTYVSPSAERMLGYRPSELVGAYPADLVHPDDVAPMWEKLRQITASPGTVHAFSARLRHRDGSWRLVEALGRTVSPSSADEGIVANSRDVTEQRQTEAALQRSEEHFRRLIENGSDLLMISASDGALTYVSPSAERLLGYRPSELLGLRPDDLLHPDDTCGLADSFQRLRDEPGFVTRATWRIRHRDGGWRLYEALGRTLDNPDGEPDFVLNARDITERVAAEEALRRATAEAERAREEAERANHAKSEFLSRMSHELRTPLNSILGFAQVLEDVELEPEYRNGVRHILNGGRHLLRLINEVLDIARIEADREALSLEPVRLGAVVREAVDMVRPLAATRRVQLAEVTTHASERYVHADRQRLAQVLLNLLSNAVKYNRLEGAVRIGCEAIRGADGAERLSVRVADQGRGIAPEQRDQLFVPFARLGAEHTAVEGTGLGLALSQRLARAMGGALTLEHTGPEGSVFQVELRPAPNPLAGVAAQLTRAEPAGDAAHAPGTLLYVEDNLANLSLVETILRTRPAWRLVPALQGRLGLELAAEHAPDLVLLDLHLPDISGREVLRQLRLHPRTAHIPVVVISADATARTMETLRAEGADDFLTKPLDVRTFLTTVERHLRPAPPPLA